MRPMNHPNKARDGEAIQLGAAPGFPIVARIAVGNGPISGIAASPAAAVLDSATGRVDTIDLPDRPGTVTECVRVSPDGNRLYVATNGPAGGQLVIVGSQPQSGVGGRVSWRRKSPGRWRVIGTV